MSAMRCLAADWVLPDWVGVGEDFQDGFFAGVAVCLCLFLIVLLMYRLSTSRRGANRLQVGGPTGDLYITLQAVREFVSGILREFDGLTLRALRLKTRFGRPVVQLELVVSDESALPGLRDAVQGRLIREMQDKLGLDRAPRINLVVRSLKVSTSRRRSRPEVPEWGGAEESATQTAVMEESDEDRS